MAEQIPEGAPAVTSPAVAREISPVYTKDELSRELRQSEIISNLTQFIRDPSKAENELLAQLHPYAIILSQDCDLLWDYESRAKNEERDLNGVLIYEIEPALETRAKVNIPSDLWKPIRQNKNDRYHFLETVPAAMDMQGEGIPQLLIDFKKCFTLPADEIYRQCEPNEHGAKRRCRLEMPYREHLQSRAAFYMQRVMLPLPHKYEEAKAVKALPKPVTDN